MKTFEQVFEKLCTRSGDFSPDEDLSASDLNDLRALLNSRLGDASVMFAWPWIVQILEVDVSLFQESKYINFPEEEVLDIFISDPRKDFFAESILHSNYYRCPTIDGKIFLPADVSTKVWLKVIPPKPDYSQSTQIREDIIEGAIELTLSDKLEQDGQNDKAAAKFNRANKLLDSAFSRCLELCDNHMRITKR